MKNFSLILPTRNRALLVERLFDSIIKTTCCPQSLEIVLYLDDDDVESRKISHPAISIVKLFGPKNTMGNMLRLSYQASTGRYIVLMNDDAIIRTRNWDTIALRAFQRFSDEISLVYANDRYYGRRMPTFPMLSRSTCDLLGKICPPDYKKHCIETHMFDIFQRLSRLGHKRLIYLPDVIFEHMNYGVTLQSYDTKCSNEDHAGDKALYLSLAEDRQKTALKMARYIESHKKEPIISAGKCAGKPEYLNLQEELSIEKTSDLLPPPVTIIMRLSGNLSQYSSTCLKAVCGDDKPKQLNCEIVVICDDSTKCTSALTRKLRKKITIISCKDANTVKAFNKGAAAAKGDYLVFLDDECLPEKGWLEALVESAGSKEIAIVGSKWLNPRNGRVEHIGVSFFEDNKIIKDTCIYKGFLPAHPVIDRVREFQAVKILGMLVKKDIFSQVKGFDENLVGLEHIDICLKVRRLGKKVIYSPQASFYRYDWEIAEKGGRSFADLRNLPPELRGEIKCDLEELLIEDGFLLCLGQAGRYIQPLPS